MSNNTACTISEVTWGDVRKEVKKVNEELFHIIEQLDPNNSFKLIKASYRYGEKITDLGTICVPNKLGQLTRLDDANASEHMQKQLSYGPTPLILQLHNASEVFIDAGERIIPLNIFHPGDLYGLFEAIVPLTGAPIIPCWNVTSGGRSVFFATKITDAICHKRIKAEYGLRYNAPRKLTEHWKLFKDLQRRSGTEWTSEILIFTDQWFKKRDDDIHWLRFQNYLLTKAWVQSRNIRVKSEYSAMWEAFASAICARHLKPNPYIVNTIMHLMFLANGAVPGFNVITEGNNILPFRLLENIYANIYGLKNYAPFILAPVILETEKNDSCVYYSLAYPTVAEGTPAIRSKPNIITEVRDVKLLMSTLQNVLRQQTNKRLYHFMDNISFNYYHSDDDKFGELKNSKDIPNDDAVIANLLKTKYKNKQFPSYGQFFRGCIRIAKMP